MARALNPYIAGNPLSGERGFFGRQDTLQWVISELRNPGTNALVLSGQRRIGKTSVLKQLERRMPTGDFLPVYFDLQHHTTRPLSLLLSDLADKIAERAGMEPPDPTAFDDEGHFFQNMFLPRLYNTFHEGKRPIFLLDEFDVLDQVAEADLPDTAAAKSLFPFLRRLMSEDTLPAFVFVIGRRPDDLSIDLSSIFKTSLKYEIWVLDRESAGKLIRQAEDNGSLRFTGEAVDRIYNLTSGHPYLTQLLCQRLWQKAYTTLPQSPPIIEASDLETIIPEALTAGEPALTWLWNGLGPAEKIYAAALAEIAGPGEIIPEERIIQVITANARRLRTREVELAPNDLVKRRVLEVTGERQYRFAVELFQMWVKQSKPLSEVKDELDRIEPVADRLFSLGRDFFNRGKWEDATRYFQEALDQYSEHFGARLYLGEAHLKLEKVDQAVEELALAYQKDEAEARFPLVRALIAKASASEQAGQEEEALEAAIRALEISPNEELALGIRETILTRRGEAALKRNDLASALEAFRQIKDTQKITQVESLMRQQALKQLESRVRNETDSVEWDRLIEQAEEARLAFPETKEWDEIILKARRQKEIIETYAEALQEMEAGRSSQAAALFTKVAGQQPDFMDTLYYLMRLYRGIDVKQLDARLREEQRRCESLQGEINTLQVEKALALEQLEQANRELAELQKNETWFSRVFRRRTRTITQAAKPADEPVSAEMKAPLARFTTAYKLGDDLFDESFSIESETGEFLAECGIGISETIGVRDPKRVTAFEFWLFDKEDIRTATKVISSMHAYRDSSLRDRMSIKGELVLAESGKQVLLETSTIKLIGRISDMRYGNDAASPAESYFNYFVMDLHVWRQP